MNRQMEQQQAWVEQQQQQAAAQQKAAAAQQQQLTTNETALRKEWMTKAQPFIARQQKVGEVLDLLSQGGSGTSLASKYGFQKLLDPNMVTEGDMRSLSAMGSTVDKVESAYQAWLKGDSLTGAQRQDLANAVQVLAQANQRNYSQTRAPYEGIASRAGYDPRNVFAGGFQQGDPAQIYMAQLQSIGQMQAPPAPPPPKPRGKTGKLGVMMHEVEQMLDEWMKK
jgi:hypothetical protein